MTTSLPDGFARSLFRDFESAAYQFPRSRSTTRRQCDGRFQRFCVQWRSIFHRQFYEIGTSLTGMTPYRWMDDRTELA